MLPRIVTASDHSLLVVFGTGMNAATHAQVRRLSNALLASCTFRNVHPAYATVLVSFDPLRCSHAQAEAAIRTALEQPEAEAEPPRTVEIPVRYDGVDLEDVAANAGLTRDDVVRLHASGDYVVHFLGFAPGFPYLAGMPPQLATPRLAVPRTRVPAGSVAIGGKQTGVYPVEMPGGWRIIGHTDLPLFRPDREPITLLNLGDRVRFMPIS